MKKQHRWQIAMLFGLALLWQAALYGQSDFGAILGTVVDPSGAVIAGVQVSLAREDTGFSRAMVSTDAGEYNITNLAPGLYMITAELAGFKKYEQKNVQLIARQVLRLDIRLELGEVTETVTVDAPVVPVNSETPTISETVSLAKLSRNPYQLAKGAFVSTHAWQTLAITGTGGARWKISGARNNQVRVAVDGRVTFDPFGMPGNMLNEVTITHINANAEFAVPGTIAGTSKGGTSEYHGQSEIVLQHPRLNSIGPNFAPRVPTKGTYDNSNQLGGPVIIPGVYNGRDRGTFFLVNFDKMKSGLPSVAGVSNVPTVRMRSGDFSAFRTPSGDLIPIIDPLTGNPFPGNIIPANRINPVSLKVVDLIQLPNRGAPENAFQNWVGQETGKDFQTRFVLRLDHKVSGKDTVNFIYKRYLYGGRRDPLFGSAGYIEEQLAKSYTVTHTHVFNPSTVNEFRFSFDNLRQARLLGTNGQEFVKRFGIQGIDSSLDFTGMPNIGPWVRQRWSHQITTSDRFYYQDNLTHYTGKHTIKAGANYYRLPQKIEGTADNAFGTYNFTGRFTRGTLATAGSDFADLLLGYPDSTTRFIPRATILPFNFAVGAYVQDDWKITPRVTLNFGLRYDLEGAPRDRNGLYHSFNPKTGAIVLPDDFAKSKVSPLFNKLIPLETASQAGYPAHLVPTDKNNFVPRLGLAFRPFNNAKTVIRAGYGIFTSGKLADMQTGASAYQLNTGGPFALSETFQNTQPGGRTVGPPTLSFPNPFLAVGQGSAPSSYAITFLNPDYRDAYMQQWNVTFEQEVLNTAVRLSYVGSKGTNLLWSRNINLLRPSTIPWNISGCGTLGPRPGPTCRRNYYGFTSVEMVDGGGNDSYNSMQLEFNRPFARGLQFAGGWLWQRKLTDADASPRVGGGILAGLDPYDRRYGRGAEDAVPQHQFKLDFTWEAPVGRGKRFLSSAPSVLNHIVGGWSMSFVGRYTYGVPYNPTYNGGSDPSGNGIFSGRADRIASGKVSNFSESNWFDPSAFVRPPCGPADPTYPGVCMPIGRYGSSGRNILGHNQAVRNEGVHEMMSVFKNFPIVGERVNLRLVTYFWNPFNKQYPGVNTNISDAQNVGKVGYSGIRTVMLGAKLMF